MTDTDKEQPDQNCCQWMKTYWLEILLGIIALVIISVATWILWGCLMREAVSGYSIQTLVFAFIVLGLFCGSILAIRRYWLEGVLIIFASLITEIAVCNWGGLTETAGSGSGSGYAIRTLVFAYGGLGGFYGLIVAARRLRVSEAGLFNDRLGRGVKALANEKLLYIRTAGVRILEDLHKTAEPADKKLILNLLSDFIRDKADKYDSKGDKHDPKGK